LPITYLTFMIGSLALCAIPPFAGFYSKDTIIEAAGLSHLAGASYAYYCVLAGAFITPLYTFRALFMTFHTKPRMDKDTADHIKEASWVVWMPLVLLAIPSVVAGGFLIQKMLYGHPSLLGNSIFVLPEHKVMEDLAAHFHGAIPMALSAGYHLTLWLALAGIATAWLFTAYRPALATWFTQRFSWLYTILIDKFGFDRFNQVVLVEGTQDAGHLFYDVVDVKMIDGVGVNGTARLVTWFARTVRKVQTGYLYHYALSVVLGLVFFLLYFVWGL